MFRVYKIKACAIILFLFSFVTMGNTADAAPWDDFPLCEEFDKRYKQRGLLKESILKLNQARMGPSGQQGTCR
jgi:hypothetical protein